MNKRKPFGQFWKRKKVRSGLEKRIREDLDERKIKYEYESVRLRYIKTICPNCDVPIEFGTYTPDFTIERSSGVRLLVEAKGRWTGTDREKHKRVRRDNPTEDIRFVFQRDQPIRKGSSTRYSDYCLKHDYLFCFGESVPQEWIEDTGIPNGLHTRATQGVQKKTKKRK